MSNGTPNNDWASKVTFIRLRDIIEIVPISRATVYRLAKNGQFPKPIRLGSSSLWVEAEVQAWLSERMANR
ncbi:AlpA family phage regulatory protein [Aureimonas ureilytica]|uniref:helix-turn-helix transcriptional regulator n=1 Tax=Aureimonas ureilytica TaxID=401562 RepID=UPI0009EBAC51